MSAEKQSFPQGRRAEANYIATLLAPVTETSSGIKEPEPIAKNPERALQHRIINQALSGRENLSSDLAETFDDPFAQGLNREALLLEYTTAQLARQYAITERNWYRSGSGDIQFYVHTAGMEIAQIAVQRHLSNDDAYGPYYRGQAADLYRGGTPQELFAQDMSRTGDTHSKSRQLGGHVASDWRSELPAISMTGAHMLTMVGIATALNNRQKYPQRKHSRFSRNDAIAVAELGEASMAEGEVMEALSQAVKDKSALVTVVYDNEAGISMGKEDTSVASDPILFARSYEPHGFLIKEVSGMKLYELVETARDVVCYTREKRMPSLLLIRDLYRVTDHTSSSQQEAFTAPNELERRKTFDKLSAYKTHLAEIGIATLEELTAIEQGAKQAIEEALEEVIARPIEKPEKVYEDVYSPHSTYGPIHISNRESVPSLDHLQSTRTEGVDYTDKHRQGPEISARLYTSLVLAQEMKRDPRIVVYGEDVAMVTAADWHNLDTYFSQRSRQKNEIFSQEAIERARTVLDLVQNGQGYKTQPEDFAVFAELMEGKGGVFKHTQFLQWLFGQKRVHNFPIREAGIVGTAIGRAIAGELPVIEMQFDAYTSPAFQQIHDVLSTLRWRGAGQFSAGMVIRIQGMNRIGGDGITRPGGIGGIGHGASDISRFLVPGLRHFIPGDVEDMGAGLREAIRVAGTSHEPVLVYEPINLSNEKGIYQGPSAHIPLGEAEVVNSGEDLTIIAWSNNVRIAKAVSDQLAEEGMDAGVINARALGNQFDWEKVGTEIKRSNRVLIIDAGRKDGDLLAGKIQAQFFDYLDAPVISLGSREVPMPAGKRNEAFVVPQYEDIIAHARQLIVE